MSKKFLSNLGAIHNAVNIEPDGHHSDKANGNPQLLHNKHHKNRTDMRRLLFCKDYMMHLYQKQLKEQATPSTALSKIFVATPDQVKQIRILLTKAFEEDVMNRIYCAADGRINIDKFEEIIAELERLSQARNRRPHPVGSGGIHEAYEPQGQSAYKHHLNY